MILYRDVISGMLFQIIEINKLKKKHKNKNIGNYYIKN